MKTNKVLKEVASILADYPDYQIFSNKNIAGDHTKTIYCQNNIRIDVCHKFEYLEILTANGEPIDKFTLNSIKGYLEEIKKEQNDSTMNFIKSYIKEKEVLVTQKELDELAECFNFDEYDEVYDLVNSSLEMLEKSIYNKENLDLKKLHNNLKRLKELV